jgi:hypothetical protein
MLLSPIFWTSSFGTDVSPYERLVCFGLGHLEREHQLNQHALLEWCRGPDPYMWLPRVMQAAALVAQATCSRELALWIDHHAAWLRVASDTSQASAG